MVEWHRLRFAVLAATVLSARSGAAQGRHGVAGANQSGASNGRPPPAPVLVKPSAAVSEAAEDAAHSGDCAAALDKFDRALQNDVSPELHRDRGICHEKLGHPFPAIDDYRFYLESRPDAADADKIRSRLDALEKQTGVIKPRAKEADITTSIGGDPGTSTLDAMESGEQLDSQADHSSLRRGRGFVFGVGFDVKHYGSSGFGWAEGGAIDLRYSLSSLSTVLLEVDLTHVNSSGSASSLSGPGFFGGYEARIPLNARLDDAFLLGGTLGYEHLSQSATGFVYSVVDPQVRLGYRHVFGPTFGLEGTLDGGVAIVHLTAPPEGTTSATNTTSLFGLHVAAVFGF